MSSKTPEPAINYDAWLATFEAADQSTREFLLRQAVEFDPAAGLHAVLPDHDPAYFQKVIAEYDRIRARAEAQRMFDEANAPTVDPRPRTVDGGSFIYDLPDEVPTVWGDGKSIVWAEGEALTLTGPPGVGKTTLAGQLVRARVAGGKVLGLPVAETSSRVLYLAMDRPQQIARALRRTLYDLDRDVLADRLIVWQGPPLHDVAKHPQSLADLARQHDADTVVVDSLKDAAIGLMEDQVAGGYNRARQECLAAGVEVLELHHMVKRGEKGSAPRSLADVYGSAWITAGSGSVVNLHGDAGDPVVQWRHLKQPAEEVGPFQVMHDHDAGLSQVWHPTDLLAMVQARGAGGLTAKDAAEALFDTTKPTAAQTAKARRRLDALVRAGELDCETGDSGTQKATVWLAVDPFQELL